MNYRALRLVQEKVEARGITLKDGRVKGTVITTLTSHNNGAQQGHAPWGELYVIYKQFSPYSLARHHLFQHKSQLNSCLTCCSYLCPLCRPPLTIFILNRITLKFEVLVSQDSFTISISPVYPKA
jgi:hypothetical protein